MTRRRPSPSRSGGNRPPPPSSRPPPALPPGPATDTTRPRRTSARGPRRRLDAVAAARALSLSCCRERRREARARLPAARRGARRRGRGALGGRRLRRLRRAGTACAPTRSRAPPPGCTFVAGHMTAAHLVLVWEERDDPNLLWHAQRAMEVGPQSARRLVRAVVRPERLVLRLGGGRATGPRRARQGLTTLRRTTPGIAASPRAALYVSRSPGGGCGGAPRARCSRPAGSRSGRPCSSASSPARRSRRTAASRRRSSGSRPPRARCARCGSACRSAPPQALPGARRDGRARSSRGIGLPGPTPIVLFRESTVAGHFVSLAGVEGLAPHVRLTSGRLPRRCTPARCEVAAAARARARCRTRRGCGSSRSGRATLRSSQLFGDFLAPTDNALADREVGAGAAAGGRATTGRRRRRSSSRRGSRR